MNRQLTEANKPERLSLKNDFLFKRMFGEQVSKDLLIALLNAILQRTDGNAIKDLVISSDKKLTGKRMDAKEGVLDVYCETYDNELINIEMQVQPYPHMEKRSMYYVGKLFVDSLDQGESHSNLKKTIGINLLDYSLLSLDHFHSTFHLYEDKNRDYMLTDVWEIHFIEFKKFRKQAFNINDPLHRWLRYMDERISPEQLEELMSMDPVIHKAEERMKELSADTETRLLYLSREKAIRDQISMREYDLKKGEEMGLEKGLEKGKAESLKVVALNMLSKGIDVAMIAEFTGLSHEQIESLRTK